METWSYESLCFYVDKDGIESMTYSNPYTIGNIKTENLNLLSFSEVMKIYEKMMELTDNDHEISDEAASWCELAAEGEIYEFAEGEVEITDIVQILEDLL